MKLSLYCKAIIRWIMFLDCAVFPTIWDLTCSLQCTSYIIPQIDPNTSFNPRCIYVSSFSVGPFGFGREVVHGGSKLTPTGLTMSGSEILKWGKPRSSSCVTSSDHTFNDRWPHSETQCLWSSAWHCVSGDWPQMWGSRQFLIYLELASLPQLQLQMM